MHCPVQSGDPQALLDYCARTLRGDALPLIESHLGKCPECRKFADAQAIVWSALDSWEAEEVSGAFDARLYAAVEAQGSRASLWDRLFGGAGFSWKPALNVGTACAAAVLAVVLVNPGSAPVSPEPKAAADSVHVDSLEPEQIERTVEDIEMLKQLTAPSTQSAGGVQTL